ncbi:MAG TPA: hypothetical protein DCR43_07215 [Bacteroidales bacterium]|nr:MAG: hypothetical protein A2X11_16685 [Bacteroidetes bacterium GWE2_42_24]HAQ65623.1 hypothetical protein [Bacteroidales bacterium]HBZ66929.1 hypothetical protein [Bacteroidales bacterium]
MGLALDDLSWWAYLGQYFYDGHLGFFSDRTGARVVVLIQPQWPVPQWYNLKPSSCQEVFVVNIP